MNIGAKTDLLKEIDVLFHEQQIKVRNVNLMNEMGTEFTVNYSFESV